ncbi:MAG: WYL domain-containing protein [Clostridia bacterium]|nr:WYL domain-containing protein [Clostridia bacterium]
MLFSELYSAYYNTVAAILKESVKHPVSAEKLRGIATANAFGDSFITIENKLKNGEWPLISEDGTSVLEKAPDMPLTLLQKRWLKAISLDPRVRLFGDVIPDFPDVEPLFTQADYAVFDKYSDGDNYEDEEYVRRFRFILQSIGKRQPLRFEVENRTGRTNSFSAMPEYLEYSEKDDKFRLVTSGCRYGTVINLGRVVSCNVSRVDPRQLKPGVRCSAERILVLEVTDERNALERVLLHFAHFEKEAAKADNGKYRVTLKYEKDDETEMVIRVLSFGPLVKAVSPQSFAELIKARLKMQKSCGLF